MGACTYCGQPAGLLRSRHAECASTHDKAIIEISHEIVRALRSVDEFAPLKAGITALAEAARVSSEERRDLLVRQWEEGVEHFLSDGQLDADEERRLRQYHEQFQLTQTDLDKRGAYTKFVKAGALRELLEGVIPKRVNIIGTLPINLQKGEQVVWVFSGSQYLEDKTRRQYVGRTQGVSVRILKGVYYRTGVFKGQAIDSTVRTHVDTGLVVVTDRNLYFAGQQKGVRVPYKKIVSFEPYSDGIGVMRDAATAKPQIFVTGDGWFTYNLVRNLAKINPSEG
jgi:hypothetical protein